MATSQHLAPPVPELSDSTSVPGSPRAQGGTTARSMAAVGWLTLAWAFLLAFICLRKNWRYEYDDAFITMRYARHLIQGLGPRWNLTGAPVEGFSSPLHLLLVALLGMAHVPLIAAARVIGFASHAVLVVFLWRFMARRDGKTAATLASALVISSWPMLIWDLGGLESSLFAATLAIGTLLTLEYIETGSRQTLVAGGALLGLATFVRPEGALVAAAALLACLVLGQSVTFRHRGLDVTLGASACALVVLPWEVFRLLYYRDVLPNTYYAKIYGISLAWRVGSGLVYWKRYARAAPNLALLAFAIGIVVLLRRRGKRFDMALWGCMAAYGLDVIASGGDHMMAYRFMVPLVPLMAVTLARGFEELDWLKTAGGACVVSLVLAAASARQIRAGTENPVDRDWAGLMGEEIGHYITAHWPPGSVIGVNVAGTTAYFADRMEFIDMLGLNDRSIAKRNPIPMNLDSAKEVGHIKGDGAGVLARRPDYIIPIGGGGPLLRPNDTGIFLTEYELSHLPAFWQEYEPCEVELSTPQEPPNDFPKSFEFIYYQQKIAKTACLAPPQTTP